MISFSQKLAALGQGPMTEDDEEMLKLHKKSSRSVIAINIPYLSGYSSRCNKALEAGYIICRNSFPEILMGSAQKTCYTKRDVVKAREFLLQSFHQGLGAAKYFLEFGGGDGFEARCKVGYL